jgi:hypothetical protein
MVTLSPEELNWAQRSCHTDPQTDVGRANFAGLLYLFKDRRLGGTGFYQFRNRATLERATAIGTSDPAGALHHLQKQLTEAYPYVPRAAPLLDGILRGCGTTDHNSGAIQPPDILFR